MPRTAMAIAPILLVVSLAAAQSGTATKTLAKKTAATQAAPQTGYKRVLMKPASLNEKAPEAYEVKFTTTKGDFVIKLTRAWAPRGADRFYNLVKHGYYDDASFFRVLPGFVVQFGLSAHPQVSLAWQGARIPDDPVGQSNVRGNVTFATAGANTRTTQVFINLADNSRLDAMGFAPFGQVSQGMEVIEQLYSGYGESPRQELIVTRGRAYLDAEFPKLDRIKSAVLISPPPAEPAKAPAKGPFEKPPEKPTL